MKPYTNYPVQNDAHEILNLSRFVVAENFKHHTLGENRQDFQEEINSIYKEEMDNIKNSRIISLKNSSGKILGAIRTMKWDFINPLPIEKLFGINPLMTTEGKEVNEIWHVGRFAINKNVGGTRLLKKLMVSAIAPIVKHKGNMLFAEVDAKLLRVLNLMGIKSRIIGDSIDYLGSKTYPVSMSYNGLIKFYNENKHLISCEFINEDDERLTLQNKVVIDA